MELPDNHNCLICKKYCKGAVDISAGPLLPVRKPSCKECVSVYKDKFKNMCVAWLNYETGNYELD